MDELRPVVGERLPSDTSVRSSHASTASSGFEIVTGKSASRKMLRPDTFLPPEPPPDYNDSQLVVATPGSSVTSVRYNFKKGDSQVSLEVRHTSPRSPSETTESDMSPVSCDSQVPMIRIQNGVGRKRLDTTRSSASSSEHEQGPLLITIGRPGETPAPPVRGNCHCSKTWKICCTVAVAVLVVGVIAAVVVHFTVCDLTSGCRGSPENTTASNQT